MNTKAIVNILRYVLFVLIILSLIYAIQYEEIRRFYSIIGFLTIWYLLGKVIPPPKTEADRIREITNTGMEQVLAEIAKKKRS